MRTSIYFIDKKETILMSIDHDVNPIDTYKVGDKIYLEIDTIIYPKTKSKLSEKYKQEFVDCIIDKHEEDVKKLNKRFKIVSKYHSIKNSINFDFEYSQIIQYTVKESEQFYFKWWYIRYLLKKPLRWLKIIK
jgi:hypothetical protein